MKMMFRNLLLFTLLFPMFCYSGDISTIMIEDKQLSKLPADVEAAVKHDNEYVSVYSACSLIGRPIVLGKAQAAWFVTTEPVCEWGAYLGPIWMVVQGEKGNLSVIFDSGYQLDVLKTEHHGLPDIEIGYASMAGAFISQWRYDGERYRFYVSRKEDIEQSE